ncbi:PAS domain S-box-containing protein [Caloranaerobacter azorensis DSM 13643]|uniref:PAS domain S-box-containing protein n=1 Tax=Caloranaerobacter azorensis DSM 13643 TaxID=1121264 RepID=A0A1M5UY43_9FIRM|nr:sigma 54-interacting transcriptional regulator [Caloranaerobacter azorensis]SHH67850.1 PAS domain S-box-containing protein [Caloranaerobacter azorensis DSM 13643]
MSLINSFEEILKNITDAVIGIDKSGNVIIINEAAKRIFGLQAVKEKKLEDFISSIKLNRVLKTGKKEVEKEFTYNERKFILSKMPLFKDKKIEGAIALFREITDLKKIEEDKIHLEILNTILDVLNERVVVVDEKGIIIMMSKAYKEFIGCENPEGKHVTEVIENTRMHIILKTGVMEIGEIQEVQGNKMVSMRIPIKRNGKVIGAVGKVMFKDVSDLVTLTNKVNRLEQELEYYKRELNKERTAKYSFKDIIGSSASIQAVKELAMKVAKTDSNVLITGESGTGKELFAHAIHNASKRYLGPFIRINCAAIPEELLESELFGYEEGAFTGARKGGKKGKFELANGGTILLDEIGDMSIKMQAKLLRVLQEKEIERLGGDVVRNIDVRIIASTNKDLEMLVRQGLFREDLYFRLNVMSIKIPPLRERKEDISILAKKLLVKVSSKLGKYVEGISNDAIKCLESYDWPGNIRELENVIERAINLLDSDLIIKPEHLPEKITKNKTKKYFYEGKGLKNIIEEIEKEIILKCLEENDWNKNKVAKILGISRVGLYKKIERYNLNKRQLC